MDSPNIDEAANTQNDEDQLDVVLERDDESLPLSTNLSATRPSLNNLNRDGP